MSPWTRFGVVDDADGVLIDGTAFQQLNIVDWRGLAYRVPLALFFRC